MSKPSSQAEIGYAQCWEDADVLLAALNLRAGAVCLSIASGGDNTLALLARDPARVIAIDTNPAQLACLALRVAAYRTLNHTQLLELTGSRPSERRAQLYQFCRPALEQPARSFWDARPDGIAQGVGSAGRFERYLALFRKHALPLVQSPRAVNTLLHPAAPAQRQKFFDKQWNHWRWRMLFRVFFSRPLLERFARYPGAFKHAQGDLASHLLGRTRHAMTELDPADNPYMQWLLRGDHLTALPFALRPENFETIRARLDRLELRCEPLTRTLGLLGKGEIDGANLSNVFEYMPAQACAAHLERLVPLCRSGANLVYWNLLADRARPAALADRLASQDELAARLHQQDKVFFYRRLVIETVL